MLTTLLISWNTSSRLHWMLFVRLKHAEYASLVAVVHRCHCQLRPQWLSGGVGVWNAAGYALVVKATKKTFVDVAVTLTDSSIARRQLVSSRIGQCVNARQRWSAVRKWLHDDNQSDRTNDDVSFCNMFANCFVPKIDSLKAAITSHSLILRLLLLILSALFHLCNCSNPSPLLRSLNFFQLFHQNLAV